MQVLPIKTKLFKEGEDIVNFIISHVEKLEERSVLVITSKIVALSEKRTAEFPNLKAKEKIIKEESDWAKNTKYTWLTYKDGMFMAAAGIDESNAEGKLILLPKDSFDSASKIRRALLKHYGIKNLGVVITDSRTLPLRRGVLGIALGYAGIKGLRDYRKTPDLFGRSFEYSMTNVADGIAAAAVLVMGEGKESTPILLVEDATVEFTEKMDKKELRIPFEDDMYRPLFKAMKGVKREK